MKSKEEITQIFDQEISESTWWQRFKGSEFVKYLVNFVAQVSYRTISACERLLQEGFISKAVTTSGILAHAESRNYVPIKRTETIHTISIENTSSSAISFPANTVLIEQSSGRYYLIDTAVVITGNSTKQVVCRQISIESHNFVVNSSVGFFEVELPRETSALLSDLTVYVTESDGIRRQWNKTHLFRNSNGESLSYVEFFSTELRNGVRFGNGSVGKKPELNAAIEIECTLTNGYTELPVGATLKFENASLNDSLTVSVVGTVQHGSDRESIESIKYSAMYYNVYDNNLVFNGDYEFFIHERIKGLTFLSVWGEAEQEKMHGTNSNWINKIFICAYHPDFTQSQLSQKITEAFAGIDEVHLEFQPVTVKEQTYTVKVNAKASQAYPLDTVKDMITELLKNNFSSSRLITPENRNKKAPTVNEIYSLIQGLGVCTEFSVEIVGAQLDVKPAVDTYRHMDVSSSTINVNY